LGDNTAIHGISAHRSAYLSPSEGQAEDEGGGGVLALLDRWIDHVSISLTGIQKHHGISK
jgi:hypothetical protein